MKVLALETATKAGSIAVVDEASLIGEVRLDVNIAHAERVMNSIMWLLKSCSLSIDEIDAFAVSIGPGSFTGEPRAGVEAKLLQQQRLIKDKSNQNLSVPYLPDRTSM